MRRRVAPLTPPALLCLLALLLTPAEALAHRLVIECQVLAGQKIRVEGWYNAPNNPHPAGQASVQVFHADGELLAVGQLDAGGVFTFAFDKPERLRIVVIQTGHKAELVIPAEKLGTPAQTTTDATREDGPVIASGSRLTLHEWIRDVVAGVGFLLALAAFVLSVRNARKLRQRTPDGHER